MKLYNLTLSIYKHKTYINSNFRPQEAGRNQAGRNGARRADFTRTGVLSARQVAQLLGLL